MKSSTRVRPGRQADPVALADTSVSVAEASRCGRKTLLFEGEDRGTLLDIDHGTYPFVTSSSPTAGGIAPGVLRISPHSVQRILGVAKAYTTRVGTWSVSDGALMRRGEEPPRRDDRDAGRRRVGPAGAVGLATDGRQGTQPRVNGLTDIALTSVDTLGGLDQVDVLVGIHYRGGRIDHLPASFQVLEECRAHLRNL